MTSVGGSPSPEDIALINPNTSTCPIFRSQADAELTKKIYRGVPVLIDEAKGEAGNRWRTFYLRLVDYGDHAKQLLDAKQCLEEGYTQQDNVWHGDGSYLLPVYESKLVNIFDHRYACMRSHRMRTS